MYFIARCWAAVRWFFFSESSESSGMVKKFLPSLYKRGFLPSRFLLPVVSTVKEIFTCSPITGNRNDLWYVLTFSNLALKVSRLADWPDKSSSYNDKGCGFGAVHLSGIYEAINFTSEFIYVRSFLSIQKSIGRFKIGMTDWWLAIKIACGGFGLVFIISGNLGYIGMADEGNHRENCQR